MIQPLLEIALRPVVARRRRFVLLRDLNWAWLLLAVAALVCVLWLPEPGGFRVVKWLVAGGAALGLLAWWRHEHWQPNYHEIARSIERSQPELHALLLTAVEQRPDPATGQLSFLQQRVVQSAVEESRRHPWLHELPAWRWWLAGLTQALLLVVVLALMVRLLGGSLPAQVEKLVAVGTQPSAQADPVQVSPGDLELEKGSGFVVTARFPEGVPGAATLVLEGGPEVQRIPLAKNLGDPVFGGGVPAVEQSLTYRVEYNGTASRNFQVKVYEHPRLEKADAHLKFPAYTKLPEKHWPDFKRLTVVEGTELTADFTLNKPVRSATLVNKAGEEFPLQLAGEAATAKLPAFSLSKSEVFTLHLRDAEGRENKTPDHFILEVKANRRPELKLLSPRGDARVSPLQEVAFQAQAWDDFVLVRWGLSYTPPQGEAREVVLGEQTPADGRVNGTYLWALEQAAVQPDQLLSWHLWAEDTGPDGQVRRTTSDIFFGEVRPFEEIFREEQAGQGKPQGGQAAELAKLQKQIISATWNLQRSEEARGKSPLASERYQKEAPIVRDSEGELIRRADEMKQKMDDPRGQAMLEEAQKEMRTARERLEVAVGAPGKLGEALPPEQAAYAALLRLASHEFNISRSQSPSSGETEAPQQTQDLELSMEKQRYEQKSEADSPEAEAQKEQLALLNQLKELAQRQQDINERLREMQTALEAARNEAEREEAKRQLKRLQEEEQQMLSELDEMHQKMEQSPNASSLAEERRRVEETRQRAQQANEELRKEQASSALASGSRVQEDLQKLREDFRKKSTARFQEQLREMRSTARELARKQEELGQQLSQAGSPTGGELKALDQASPRQSLGDGFGQQAEKLEKLRENMQQVSEEAESAEPRLARELYDSLRKTAQAGTTDTLNQTSQLTGRGLLSQAQPFEKKARQELQELSAGVERAAGSVLGDEEEALRKARTDLDRLQAAIQQELGQARPDLAQTEVGNESRRGQPGDEEGQGQPRSGSEGQRKQAGMEGEKGESQSAQGSEQGGAQPGQKPGQQAAGEGQAPGQQKGQQPGAGQQSGGEKQMAQAAGAGQQPGEKPGQGEPAGKEGSAGNQPGGQEPGQQPGGQQAGTQPGQQPGMQPGGTQPGGTQPGGTQPGGQMAGQPGRSGQTPSPGQRNADSPGAEGQDGAPGSRLRELTAEGRSNQRDGAGGGAGDRGGALTGEEGPLRGDGFVKWADRLRSVEESLDDPKLRAEAAKVREVVRGMRAEFKRHSKEPNWEAVNAQVSKPLAELRRRVSDELLKRDSKESLVPIDRDPVPPQYAERVRRYYEELGRSQ